MFFFVDPFRVFFFLGVVVLEKSQLCWAVLRGPSCVCVGDVSLIWWILLALL